MENFNHGRIVPIDIEDEMRKSYIDYAMSVIVGRALPDVRDGLKPVHRRILYSMYKNGMTSDKPHKKSAHVVGDVLAKYHPHGDTAVYDAMVRMAQTFSTRYPLVDGHGNFGSVDGDSAAAMRYTEVRMTKLSLELLNDIEKNTIDYIPNYDESLEEPVVLPSRYPNLLVNGSSGIAVGMATNIPPHNLGEVIDGVTALIDNSEITNEELCEYVKGPDFPTGSVIMGREGIKSAYTTGRGSVKVRARTHMETMSNSKIRIVVTEIPYLVNKARLIEKIADLVRDKKIDGITDLRDESDRTGMRIVVELRRDANPQVILNQLYKFTQLQDTFSIIMLAVVNGSPKVLTLKDVLYHYLEHQKDVIVRRTKFDLERAEARAHIIEGLKIALDNIDEVIKTIRASKNAEEAKQNLINKFVLSDKQAQAILDMRLQRLTGLEREKLDEEYAELVKKIEYLRSVLSDENMVLNIIKEEITLIKSKYSDERLSEIGIDEDNANMEDLIAEEDVIITISHNGYVKRMLMDNYKSQRRGGKGITAMTTREEDFVEMLFTTTTHHYLLFFTNKGKVYRKKVYEIPESSRQAKGMAIINLLNITGDEKITAVIPIKTYTPNWYLIAATSNGIVKKTDLSQYDSQRKDGIIAISLDDNDELVGVQLTDGSQDMILSTRKGMAIRFNEEDVRAMGRTTRGVKGISLQDDFVISMERVREGGSVLVVSDNGYGKKTPISEYRSQNRGGKGIITMRKTDKNGLLVGTKIVRDEEEIMLISKRGIIIRLKVSEVSSMSRTTQGVHLMNIGEDDEVMAIARVVN
ncbi:DNA gyrase subunit A [Desulfonispora thiosulfatigenes DSM 11270]|uniref:DNA gyrase subunit A n=1 Tax=Desulfonispora thiosulfatigenes DSM 11270 TaxID=656914 RepID=A0A1W1V2C6_DESTI|nr:DNA gyrase subunit A [Desulfonispora thiosulfatigenes]SMB87473.1 DNA gyrase subunit A [Desulfonispora thiosulfatigenes DSM 11270]